MQCKSSQSGLTPWIPSHGSCLGLEGGGPAELLFHGYRVSVLPHEKSFVVGVVMVAPQCVCTRCYWSIHLKSIRMVKKSLACMHAWRGKPVGPSEKPLPGIAVSAGVLALFPICFSSFFVAPLCMLPGTSALFSGPSSSLPQTRCPFGKMARPCSRKSVSEVLRFCAALGPCC